MTVLRAAIVVCLCIGLVPTAEAAPRVVEVERLFGEYTDLPAFSCGDFDILVSYRYQVTSKTVSSTAGELLEEMMVIHVFDEVLYNSERPELSVAALPAEGNRLTIDHASGMLSAAGIPMKYVIPGVGPVKTNGRVVVDLETGTVLREFRHADDLAAAVCGALTP